MLLNILTEAFLPGLAAALCRTNTSDYVGAADPSEHERETLTSLAFLRKSQNKQDAGHTPHEVNVSGTARWFAASCYIFLVPVHD